MHAATTVLVDSLRFPESPRWHAGHLWCCDFFTRQVLQIGLNGSLRTVLELADFPSAIGWTPAGQLLVVSGERRLLLRLDGDNLVEVTDLSALVAYPCNELLVDGHGRAYIGNLGFDFGSPDASPEPGPLLLISPDGSARVVAEGLAFPNGMVLTPDGQTLIVAESYGARLTAFAVAPDGALTNRQVWAQFDDSTTFETGRITPDGICLDAEDAVWIASPTTREVLRVREGGAIAQRISLATIPLACMLGGQEHRTLCITTTDSLDPNDTDARGRIETIVVAVPGAGLP
jgi:sugar lactone lactonase YvrE